MCILFIYRNPLAGAESFKFILASNRDEYYNRPAKEAHFWNTDPQCIGGMDMEPGREKGTWLAASVNERLGVILNLSNETKGPKKGRGFLVADYIFSSDSTLNFLKQLHTINQEQQLYNPYNLVIAEMKNANVYCLSSYEGAPGPEICEDQILGFCNSRFPRPYKKVQVGKNQFEQIVDGTSVSQKDNLVEKLITFLKSSEKHLPDKELVERSPTDYAELSSIYVKTNAGEYGTRTHTVILVDGNNRLTFVEETLTSDGDWKRQCLQTILN